jgi:hypothetical protein
MQITDNLVVVALHEMVAKIHFAGHATQSVLWTCPAATHLRELETQFPIHLHPYACDFFWPVNKQKKSGELGWLAGPHLPLS